MSSLIYELIMWPVSNSNFNVITCSLTTWLASHGSPVKSNEDQVFVFEILLGDFAAPGDSELGCDVFRLWDFAVALAFAGDDDANNFRGVLALAVAAAAMAAEASFLAANFRRASFSNCWKTQNERTLKTTICIENCWTVRVKIKKIVLSALLRLEIPQILFRLF